jgi:alginate O-acetyltransferase complex protein AlgJ
MGRPFPLMLRMIFKTNTNKRLLVFSFLGILFLPGLLSLLPLDTASRFIDENRRLTPFPDLAWSQKAIVQFPRSFEQYFNDHFQLRDYLILGYNWLKIKIWKRSSNKDVLVGADGWLFLSGDRVLEDFVSVKQFSLDQLEARKKVLEAKRDWLAKRGMRYLFVIPPNKQSIYSEFMPIVYQRLQGESRLDQFLSYMQEQSDVDILDLRKVMRAAKVDHQVYFRLDSHWNELGGLFASREIFRTVDRILRRVSGGPQKSISDFTISPTPRKHPGDLVRLMGFPAEVRDNSYLIEPKFEMISEEKKLSGLLSRTWEPYPAPFSLTGNDTGLTCIVFHDSFGMYLAPFFPEHFQRSLFVWQRCPKGELFKAMVEAELPDIVIEEVVERLLYYYETDTEFLPLG